MGYAASTVTHAAAVVTRLGRVPLVEYS